MTSTATNPTDSAVLTRRIRLLLTLFILGLALSGLTAFPLQWEVGLLERMQMTPDMRARK